MNHVAETQLDHVAVVARGLSRTAVWERERGRRFAVVGAL
jgi:hypothetical protein